MIFARLQLLFACLALLVAFAPHAMAASLELDCGAAASGETVTCDYRTLEAARTRQLRVTIDGQSRPARDAALYPAHGQTSAVLFLIDVSDPARAQTVARNAAAVRTMIARLQPYQKAGLAVFDTDVRVLAPIGSTQSALNAALDHVRAAGLATEFYKSIIHAETLLSQTSASRRGLVLMSDGKAEDRAYHAGDAINAARGGQIAIIGLGYAERPGGEPDLQSLEQLANATHGAYFDLSGHVDLPAALRDAPLSAIEGGGSFAFASADLFGRHMISLELKLADGSELAAKREFDFNAGRSWAVWTKALVFGGWYWLLAALLAAIALLFGLVALLRHRKKISALSAPTVLAALEELDAAGTRHLLQATAVRIGRGADNDIRLRNNSVSTNHATISRKGDGWQIVDLDSSNGVTVNGRPVAQSPLHASDVIELGEVRLRFLLTPSVDDWH